MNSIPAIGLVATGGALGAVLRYLAVLLATRLSPAPFPIGTMLVNVVGSLLIGVLLARVESDGVRLFMVTGMLGGFTTFSAFSWDALQLVQRGQIGSAAMYVIGSVVLALGAVWAGWNMGR